MTTHFLLQSLQKLSLSTVRSSNVKVTTVESIFKCFGKREFQNSAVCLRKLDSHKSPRWIYPSSKNGRWKPHLKASEMYEYTTKPVPLPSLKTGGRGPNGRIWVFHRGGGNKKLYRMMDWIRGGPNEGKPMEERVERIYYDPNRTANIALVASGERSRFIIATQHMKIGDLIKSSTKCTDELVKANEGDSYPLKCLPLGTFLNTVQKHPGDNARFATAAGVSALLVKKIDNKAIVRLPSKREICVSSECTATVGRVSNIENNKIVIGKAGRNRWRGIRPRSGRWHRKEGKHGRKIKPIKRMKVYDTETAMKSTERNLYTLGSVGSFLKM